MLEALKALLRGASALSAPPRIAVCPDCGASDGLLHDPFCTKEICPFCVRQLCSCGCMRTVLRLSEDESRAVDEYIDDSVPPLSTIMERWTEALREKGRLPFRSYPNDFFRAAYQGDVGRVAQFIDRGVSPDTMNGVGYTPIMAAARGEQLDIIELLLRRGASAALADSRGYTPLHWVVAQPSVDERRQLACVCALLSAGAVLDSRSSKGVTPLMNAAWFGCHGAVAEFLGRGADPTLEDDKGRRAFDLAHERNHLELAEKLR